MRKTIETKRLRLRPPEMRDAARVSHFSSDPAVARMTAAIPLPNPIVAVEGWFDILKARAPLRLDHVYAVDHAAHGLVGMVSVHGHGNGAFELGYWIGRPYWGQGYASEAACAAASHARLLGDVSATHFVDNPASGRVLEKAGFAYTGVTEKVFSLARGAKAEARVMRLDAAPLAACA